MAWKACLAREEEALTTRYARLFASVYAWDVPLKGIRLQLTDFTSGGAAEEF